MASPLYIFVISVWNFRELLLSTSFLCLVNSKPMRSGQSQPVDLSPVDIERFWSLKNGVDKLHSAMKSFKKQTPGGNSESQAFRSEGVFLVQLVLYIDYMA